MKTIKTTVTTTTQTETFFRRIWNKVTGFFRTEKTEVKSNVQLATAFVGCAVAICTATIGPSMLASFTIKTLLIGALVNMIDAFTGNVASNEARTGTAISAVANFAVAGICIAIASYFTTTIVVLPLVILVACVIYPAASASVVTDFI